MSGAKKRSSYEAYERARKELLWGLENADIVKKAKIIVVVNIFLFDKIFSPPKTYNDSKLRLCSDFGFALKDYYELTGEAPMIPRYALGVWWNRDLPYNFYCRIQFFRLHKINGTLNFQNRNIY